MSSHSHLLEQERGITPLAGTVFLLTTVSGFITYLAQFDSIWQQWTYLFHTLFGLALTFLLALFVSYHFRRGIGLRRPGTSALGIFSALAFVTSALTGLHISFFGQFEHLRWIVILHIQSSSVLFVLLLLHIALHVAVSNKNRKNTTPLFPSIDPGKLTKYSLGGLCGFSFATAGLTLAYQHLPLTYSVSATVQPYQLTYGDEPFLPSETRTFNGTFVDQRLIGNSDRCGTCHEQITRQWEQSIHAQAASDPSYQRNINLLAKNKGMAATRYCEGCHAPVPLLSGVLTAGGTLQTHGHMFEGVSCMACHGIDKILHTKGVGSYQFRPAREYLFANRDHWLLTRLHNLLIRIQPRLHRTEMARPTLSRPEMCATCHTQFMDKDINNWGWVKMQDEYSAWLNSPFSLQSEQTFSHTKVTRCQDCHFPLVKGDDPSANQAGDIVSHRSLGANTAIPHVFRNLRQVKLTEKFLQQSKVRLSIEIPNRKNALRSSKPISPDLVDRHETPGYFYLGETLTFSVIVSNSLVGHDFPGGTTDLNEVWLHIEARDASNRLLFENGAVNGDLKVDPNAHFYRSQPIDRFGKAVWKHDLFNMVGDSYKKTIPAGKSDIVQYSFDIAGWTKSPVIINATLKYRKFNQQYAEWVFQRPGVSLPVVNMASEAISVPIKIRPEAGAL